MSDRPSSSDAWPELPLAAWADTHATLHRWLQVAGKVRLALSPWQNHSWHATFLVTPRGLTSATIPAGTRTFRIDFDFLDHRLVIETSDGHRAGFPLAPMSVAVFYRRLLAELRGAGIDVAIHPRPNEVADPIPFAEDETHDAYDATRAGHYWRALVQSARVFERFRARFLGKSSPVHLFWGAPDLAVTRFSGRAAPPHPGGIPSLPDRVTRDAYSHEVISAGFWAGGGPIPYPAYYSYAYPEPAGFADARVEPAAAFYSRELGEFVLPYDVVRQAASPDETLIAFLQSTYEAAAERAGWDRASLERADGPPRDVPPAA
jgi:hypothetical protein